MDSEGRLTKSKRNTTSQELPVRRENERSLRILAAAEALFSQNAYEAVSIRDIADKAEVNSALIRHHFGTKDQLYRGLFERRYHSITQRRIEMVGALRIVPNSIETVTSIVENWVGPLLKMASDPNSRNFVNLLARESSDASKDRHGIIAEYLDPSAKVCIGALRRALPDVRPNSITQAYLWMIATAMSTIIDQDRVGRLAGRGTSKPAECLKDLVTFVSNGLMAIGRK